MRPTIIPPAGRMDAAGGSFAALENQLATLAGDVLQARARCLRLARLSTRLCRAENASQRRTAACPCQRAARDRQRIDLREAFAKAAGTPGLFHAWAEQGAGLEGGGR